MWLRGKILLGNRGFLKGIFILWKFWYIFLEGLLWFLFFLFKDCDFLVFLYLKFLLVVIGFCMDFLVVLFKNFLIIEVEYDIIEWFLGRIFNFFFLLG